MDPNLPLETTKAGFETIGTVPDVVNPTPEIKNATLPIVDRIAKTFKNKLNLEHAELDEAAIILEE